MPVSARGCQAIRGWVCGTLTVKGGQYGQPVSLAERASDDNLIHTTDFRRTYATVADGWLGVKDTESLLRGRFEPFPVFG